MRNLDMPTTEEERNRRKLQLDAMRKAIAEARLLEKKNERALEYEEFKASKKTDKEEKWEKAADHANKLVQSGSEAYREWITSMMEIMNALMAVTEAYASNQISKTAYKYFKMILMNAADSLLQSKNANIDPYLSVELFDKDGAPQIPTLHAKDDLLVEQEVIDNSDEKSSLQTETKTIFEQWLKENGYELFEKKDDNDKVTKEIRVKDSDHGLTSAEINQYTDAVENEEKGFAAFLEEKLHEVGFKIDFHVSIYEPQAPMASPST